MIKLLVIAAAFLSLGAQNNTAKSIYDFKVEALDGSSIDFAKFKGKKY